MYGPDWSKKAAKRQEDAIAAEKQRSKLAKVRGRMEAAATERARKAKAHLN